MKPLKIAKTCYLCYDGPWAGQTLCLSSVPTAWFKAGDKIGRYESDANRRIKTNLVWKVKPDGKT